MDEDERGAGYGLRSLWSLWTKQIKDMGVLEVLADKFMNSGLQEFVDKRVCGQKSSSTKKEDYHDFDS